MIRIIATAIFVVLLSASLARAQDTSEKPEGIICLQPACDIMKSLPADMDSQHHAAPFLIDRVRGMLTTLLDPNLPEMTFSQWLFRTLQLDLTRPFEEFAIWDFTFCDERRSAYPRPLDLCVEVSAPVHDSRVVTVLISVAEGHIVNGQTGWQETVPKIHDIYISRQTDDVRLIDSLDVARLSDLRARLRLPFEEWPAIDLKSAVVWSPVRPLAGDVVRFTITVANVGRRDAPRADVSILIGIPQGGGEELKELRRQWFPRVPAGKEVRLEISATLPRGDFMLSVGVTARGDSKRVREINLHDNDTHLAILMP